VSMMGPDSAGQKVLKRKVINKLKYVLVKKIPKGATKQQGRRA